MADDPFAHMRDQMMAEIVAEAALTAEHTGRPAFGDRVMRAVSSTPRHDFVPIELQPYAYLNRPLPIGCEKTISQPFIVALMTDLLDPGEHDVVLEVGAGAGYQAAILSRLATRVVSVEIIEELAHAAQRRLKRLQCDNVEVRVANGYYGCPDRAPFDGILVTAAAELIPPPLLAQLKPGGRMVIPTGIPDRQTLVLVEKSRSGSLSTREVLPVRFSELEDPGETAGRA